MQLHRSSKSTIFFGRWWTIVVLFLWFFWAIIHYRRFGLFFLLLLLLLLCLYFELDSFHRSSDFSLLPIFFFLSRRYNHYFHSHIEDPVHCKLIQRLLYVQGENYNTWQEGCRGDRREGRLNNTTQHTRYNTTLINYSHPYGVYVTACTKIRTTDRNKNNKRDPTTTVPVLANGLIRYWFICWPLISLSDSLTLI